MSQETLSDNPNTTALLMHELERVEDAYISGEVFEGETAIPMLGIEVDFRFLFHEEISDEMREKFDALRIRIAGELSDIEPKNAWESARKDAWIQQINGLTPAELLNYELYSRLSEPSFVDPNPKDDLGEEDSIKKTLLYRYGIEGQGVGWYDLTDNFETRIRAARPTIALRRYERAIAVAETLALDYGAEFYYENSQTSFSVWTKQGNEWRPIHTLTTAEGQRYAQQATAGILLALKAIKPALWPINEEGVRQSGPNSLVASPDREGDLRVIFNRFELRVDTRKTRVLGMLALLSGFAYGVENEDVISKADATLSQEKVFVFDRKQDNLEEEHHSATDKILLWAIHQSTVGPDDHLSIEGNLSGARGVSESMLFSILGINEGYEYDGHGITTTVEDMIGSFVVTPGGTLNLHVSEFEKAYRKMPTGILLRAPAVSEVVERLIPRLAAIHRQEITAVRAKVPLKNAPGTTTHDNLAAILDSPSLQLLSRTVLEVLVADNMPSISREEEIAKRCLSYMNIALPSDRLTVMNDTLKDYSRPYIDNDAIINHIIDILENKLHGAQQRVEELSSSISENEEINEPPQIGLRRSKLESHRARVEDLTTFIAQLREQSAA